MNSIKRMFDNVVVADDYYDLLRDALLNFNLEKKIHLVVTIKKSGE